MVTIDNEAFVEVVEDVYITDERSHRQEEVVVEWVTPGFCLLGSVFVIFIFGFGGQQHTRSSSVVCVCRTLFRPQSTRPPLRSLLA